MTSRGNQVCSFSEGLLRNAAYGMTIDRRIMTNPCRA